MLFYTLPPLMRPNCKFHLKHPIVHYNVTNQRLIAVNILFISTSISPLKCMATCFDPHYVTLKPVFYIESLVLTSPLRNKITRIKSSLPEQ
jgi:hypothetical protein